MTLSCGVFYGDELGFPDFVPVGPSVLVVAQDWRGERLGDVDSELVLASGDGGEL